MEKDPKQFDLFDELYNIEIAEAISTYLMFLSYSKKRERSKQRYKAQRTKAYEKYKQQQQATATAKITKKS